MAAHSSILSWKIPWTEATIPGIAESGTTERLTYTHKSLFSFIGKSQSGCSILLSHQQ